MPFLAERVHYPPLAGHTDDFRVRTNAALALGATNDDAAVAPLCGALSDPSDVVRQASAVALKRLARSGAVECLKGRIAVEANESVKPQIQRAIDALEPTGGGAPTPGTAVADARFYVSVSRVANHTSRASDEVERLVHGAIASKLSEVGGYQLAPPGETAESARAAITKRHLKGYFLAVAVDQFEYSAEGLRVRVKIAVFSYPGRDLRGEVPAGAVLPGGQPGDKTSEDQLMGVVATRAAELFTQNFR